MIGRPSVQVPPGAWPGMTAGNVPPANPFIFLLEVFAVSAILNSISESDILEWKLKLVASCLQDMSLYLVRLKDSPRIWRRPRHDRYAHWFIIVDRKKVHIPLCLAPGSYHFRDNQGLCHCCGKVLEPEWSQPHA